MNALRSPWVSGALVLVALGTVGYQVLTVSRAGGRSGGPQAPAAASPGPLAASPAPQRALPNPPAPAKGQPSLPSIGMDREYIALHFANWKVGTSRDPFLLHQSTAPQKASTNASSVSKWKLKAIWHQTGSRIAAINQGIYREGDSIENYKIIRIEDDAVWFQNPDSLDHLEFSKQQSASLGLPAATMTTTNLPAGPPIRKERP